MRWFGYIVLLLSPLLMYANPVISININTKSSSFIIPLHANATTGYQWSLVSFDKDIFHLISSEYEQSNTQLVGKGGMMVFRFALNKKQTYPQSSNFIFKYGRSWEPSSNAIPQKVTVHFIK